MKLMPTLEPGRYTVWAGHRGGWYLDIEESGPDEVKWEDHPEGTIVKAGPNPKVALHNDGADEETFTVERATWAD
ncbi:hypothetical protein NL529_33090, partial [Klebsiella pneumoniae]|nr:hypothetical protein [Klebsiella pneumoniae]